MSNTKVQKLSDLVPGMIVTSDVLKGTFSVCRDPQRNRLFLWSTEQQKDPSSQAYLLASWYYNAETNYLTDGTVEKGITIVDQKEEPSLPVAEAPESKAEKVIARALELTDWEGQRAIWSTLFACDGPTAFFHARDMLSMLNSMGVSAHVLAVAPGCANGYDYEDMSKVDKLSPEAGEALTLSTGAMFLKGGFAIGRAEREWADAHPKTEATDDDGESEDLIDSFDDSDRELLANPEE